MRPLTLAPPLVNGKAGCCGAVHACCLQIFRVQTCVQSSTELTFGGPCTGDYGWDTQVRLCAQAFQHNSYACFCSTRVWPV